MAVTTSPASNQTTSTPPVIDQVKALAEELRTRGAKDGTRRLDIISKQYRQFTVEGASQYIRKDDILDELDSQPHKLLSTLRFFRNLFSILPIVFTWLALGMAANAYQSDLSDSRYKAKDTYQSFLYLWQDSFHSNHGHVIPFSTAAFIDFGLLTLLVLLVVSVPAFEYLRRDNLHKSLGNFDSTIDDLLALIAVDGANSHLAPSDVNKISQAIKDQLESVLLNYDRVALETRDDVQKAFEKTTDILAYTHEKTKEVFDDFKKDLAVYNSDIKILNNSLKKMDTNLDNYGQKLTELTDASNKLAGSSNDLALNAKSMAESATLSSQASQGISNQLGALNQTQQEIVQTQKGVIQEFAEAQKQVVQDVTTSQQSVVQRLEEAQRQVVQDVTTSQQTVVQKIADSQTEVVRQLTDAGDIVAKSGENTRDAAKEMDRVASNLAQLTQTDFQRMTDGVTQANQKLIDSVNQSSQVLANEVNKTSSEVQQVMSSLHGVNAQLGQSSQQLQTTTQAFTQAMNNVIQGMNDVVQRLDTSLQALPGAQQRKRGFWPWQR